MGKFKFLDHEAMENKTSFFVVEPRHVHRPDRIASEYYGSSTYSWVVIMFNRGNVVGWPSLGEEIILPFPDAVLSEL